MSALDNGTILRLRLLQVPVYVLHAVGQCSNLISLDLLYQHSVTLEGLQALSGLTGLQVSTERHLMRSMTSPHKHCTPALNPSICLSVLKRQPQAEGYA